MDRWHYLLVLAACLAITAPLELFGAGVYRRAWRAAAAILPVAAVFITAILTIQPTIDSGQDIFVSADGQTGYPLASNDVVAVARADHALRLVRSTERSYYGVLRQKLKWAER